MTGERDVERLLERWLVDGVDEMPDRVYLSVLDRVDRQHQRRAWRVPWRDATVNGYLKPILAIAAVFVLAVGGFAIVARPSGLQVGGTASPSPSATAASSPIPSPSPVLDGVLPAGTYVAHAHQGDPMSFTLTAPAGWEAFGGWVINPPTGYAAPDGLAIAFLHDPQVVDDPCNAAGAAPSTAPQHPSVGDLAAALSAYPGGRVTAVQDATLAGLSGKRVELELPAKLACTNHYIFAEPQGFFAQGPSNHWSIWLLDAGGSTAVVVLQDFKGTSSADKHAAQRILDSLRITR